MSVTDTELLKRCAAAIGINVFEDEAEVLWAQLGLLISEEPYNPLQNKTQAMDLLMHFEMQLWPERERKTGKVIGWNAYIFKHNTVTSYDLLRAIVECVARP